MKAGRQKLVDFYVYLLEVNSFLFESTAHLVNMPESGSSKTIIPGMNKMEQFLVKIQKELKTYPVPKVEGAEELKEVVSEYVKAVRELTEVWVVLRKNINNNETHRLLEEWNKAWIMEGQKREKLEMMQKAFSEKHPINMH